LTQGDPAGIGPELALKAWLARKEAQVPAFAYVGDAGHLARAGRMLSLSVPVVPATWRTAADTFTEALPVIDTGHIVDCIPGQPNAGLAQAILASIETAVDAVRSQHAGAVVTNPIAKHVLYDAGFSHPGHTEFLAELARVPGMPAPMPVMMIWSKQLAVVPVTIHIPLKDVPAALTQQRIVDTCRIVAFDLKSRFGIAAPRLALAGLNPHAGENGALGSEDRDVIVPAIAALRVEGIDASGPYPADTMFHSRARAGYDVAIGMYHDQVLVPVKTIAFDDGVNVTLGLPFIRTSPDHGTAFDIAGKGIARPDSLIAALVLAGQLAQGGAVSPA
jgi:4-hydroxythreonine-4-phosphate dehydrogenase